MILTKWDKDIAKAGRNNNKKNNQYDFEYVHVSPERIFAMDGHFIVMREIEDPREKFTPYLLNSIEFEKAAVEGAELTSEDDFFARVTKPDGTSEVLPKVEYSRGGNPYNTIISQLPTKHQKVLASESFIPEFLSLFLKSFKQADEVSISILKPGKKALKWNRKEPVRVELFDVDGNTVTGYIMPAIIPEEK